MTEQIQDLIEKIKQEGFGVAEEKARKIEEQAKKEAEGIISRARQEADKLLKDARQQLAREQEAQKALLAQAGRDLLLSLRKEINSMLERLVVKEVDKALTPESMHKIISDLVKDLAASKSDIIITVGKHNLEELKKHFHARLKEEALGAITLKPSQDMRGGFTISFDAGKSCFDFSDKALAEYISGYIKPQLKEILQ